MLYGWKEEGDHYCAVAGTTSVSMSGGAGSARDMRQHNTIDYLFGTPLLADFLEEGLAQFGFSCEELELGRM
jgi:hypothetical protein